MIELSARVGRLSSDVDTTVALLRMFDTGPLGGRGGHEGDQRVAQGLLHGVLGGTVEGDAALLRAGRRCPAAGWQHGSMKLGGC
jgi:hypothetical protein